MSRTVQVKTYSGVYCLSKHRACQKCLGSGFVYVERKSQKTDISYYDVCECQSKKRKTTR